MTQDRLPRVYTIPGSVNFLAELARTILRGGFPEPGMPPPGPADLARWTILVPTRRAARTLEQVFLDQTNGPAMLLPSIRPIGDIDEDVLDLYQPGPLAGEVELDPPVSGLAREFLLMRLIETWAQDARTERLAQEIFASPVQTLSLARTLAILIDDFEGRDKALDLDPVYPVEKALHREAIMGFLKIVTELYPEELRSRNLMGPMRRRSELIRREARRLQENPPQHPVIAAGSTGSIMASAELLKVISDLPLGAVILPGFDLGMDGESWDALIDPENPHGPTHAQFGMRMLLKYLGLLPSHVEPLPGLSLSPVQQARDWLISEIMRPSATAAEWHRRIGGDAARVARGLEGVELLEASTPREEACQLALRIRAELSTPGRTVALVTPDRELALRIKAELSRWNIEADDSAGTSLNHTLEGSLFILILDLIASPREPVAWASLLHHPLVALGHEPEAARRIASHFDLVALRYGQWRGDIETLVSSLETWRFRIAEDPYAHPVLVRLAAEDWDALSLYGAALAESLEPLLDLAKADEPAGLDGVITPVIEAFERLTRPADIWQGEFGEALGSALISMRQEADFCPAAPFSRAAQTIAELVRNSFVRPPRQQGSRFAILGLLEARLIRADLMIMGSLNEAVWPSQPSTGPWLNRPMRAALGLAAPEKDIGLAAHDFAQGFGASRVILSWSKRVGDAPATPSRWLLRLKMLAAAADVGRDLPNRWQAWARALDHVEQGTPVARPAPRPGVRLASISVSQVERLHRDPYAVYARSLLNLVPLEPYAARPEASERGTLIHKVLEDFTKTYKIALPADPAAELMRIGYEHFAPRLDDPDIRGFWWPRFCRIAQWFAAEEAKLRREAATVMTESRGSLTLTIAGEAFRLSGRADRIDILQDNTIRILDYKTGTVPTKKQVQQGYAPQLTLEAEMIARGAFRTIHPRPVSELIYMKLSGGDPAGEIKTIDVDDIGALAKRHLAELEQKLTNLFTGVEAWIPRRAMQNIEDESEYDHLSRWREWRRA